MGAGTTSSGGANILNMADTDLKAKTLNDSSLSAVSDFDPDEFDFVENIPEELHCSICLSVLCNPTLTSCCGNHFCQGCIKRIRSDGKPCPLCQSQDYDTMLDKSVMRRVKQLKVHCPNKDQGCVWVGELGETGEHIDRTCDFVEVTCSFLCGTSLPRCHLSVHETNLCRNRPYTCPYCSLHNTYAVIAEEHWPHCASYPVECINGCGVGPVKRRDLPNHLGECPLEVIECELSVAGCGVKVSRREMPQHMKDSVLSHVALIPTVCSRFTEKLEMKDKVLAEKLEMKDKVLVKKLELKDKLLAEKLEMKDKALAELRSEFDQKLQKYRQETNNLLSIIQLLLSEIHQLQIRVQDIESKTESPPTIPLLQGEIQQLKTRVQDVERKVKLPPVHFVMTDFEDHFYWADQWFSEPFYTHEEGYKMCLSVFAYGTGQAEGDFVSVFANIMKGEFDDDLDWPFRGHLEVEVHTNDGLHYEQTFKFNSRSPAKATNRVYNDERNVFGQGCVRCIPHDEIQPLPSQLRLRVCSVTVNS